MMRELGGMVVEAVAIKLLARTRNPLMERLAPLDQH